RDFHVTGVQTCALPIFKQRTVRVVVVLLFLTLAVDGSGLFLLATSCPATRRQTLRLIGRTKPPSREPGRGLIVATSSSHGWCRRWSRLPDGPSTPLEGVDWGSRSTSYLFRFGSLGVSPNPVGVTVQRVIAGPSRVSRRAYPEKSRRTETLAPRA